MARLQFPQNPQNPGIYEERGAVVAEILAILEKLEPGDVFALPVLQTMGKLEPGDVFASEVAHLP